MTKLQGSCCHDMLDSPDTLAVCAAACRFWLWCCCRLLLVAAAATHRVLPR